MKEYFLVLGSRVSMGGLGLIKLKLGDGYAIN